MSPGQDGARFSPGSQVPKRQAIDWSADYSSGIFPSRTRRNGEGRSVVFTTYLTHARMLGSMIRDWNLRNAVAFYLRSGDQKGADRISWESSHVIAVANVVIYE